MSMSRGVVSLSPSVLARTFTSSRLCLFTLTDIPGFIIPVAFTLCDCFAPLACVSIPSHSSSGDKSISPSRVLRRSIPFADSPSHHCLAASSSAFLPLSLTSCLSHALAARPIRIYMSIPPHLAHRYRGRGWLSSSPVVLFIWASSLHAYSPHLSSSHDPPPHLLVWSFQPTRLFILSNVHPSRFCLLAVAYTVDRHTL